MKIKFFIPIFMLLILLYSVSATVTYVLNAPDNYFWTTDTEVTFNWTAVLGTDAETTSDLYLTTHGNESNFVKNTTINCLNSTSPRFTNATVLGTNIAPWDTRTNYTLNITYTNNTLQERCIVTLTQNDSLGITEAMANITTACNLSAGNSSSAISIFTNGIGSGENITISNVGVNATGVIGFTVGTTYGLDAVYCNVTVGGFGIDWYRWKIISFDNQVNASVLSSNSETYNTSLNTSLIFDYTVNGARQSCTVKLTPSGTLSAEEAVANISSFCNLTTYNNSDGKINITTWGRGSDEYINVSGGNATGIIGFTLGTTYGTATNSSSASRWFEIRDTFNLTQFRWTNETGDIVMTLDKDKGHLNITGDFKADNIVVDNVTTSGITAAYGWFTNLFTTVLSSLSSFIQVNKPINMSTGKNITYLEKINPEGTELNIGGGLIVKDNITTEEYFKGQPLDGSIGSGVIECDDIDSNGNVNLTHTIPLNITYPNMIIRLAYSNNTIKYCNISSAMITVTDDQHTVYYVDGDCSLKSTSMATYIATDLSPGGLTDVFNVVAHNGQIDVHKGITVKNKETIQSRKTVLHQGHLNVISGMDIITATFPEYTQSVGVYQFIRTVVDTTLQNSTTDNVELITHNRSTTDWWYYNGTGINLTHCDNGSDLIACSTNAYRRYLLFNIGFDDGMDMTELHQLAALDGTTYANVGVCLDIEVNPISYTLPALFDYSAIPIKIYCGKRDDTSWTENFIDLRVGKAGFGATQDTSIFLTKDGTRPLTANWNIGGYTIYNGVYNGTFNWIVTSIGNILTYNGTELTLNLPLLNKTHTHSAENITAGAFGAGDYTFDGNTNTTGNVSIGSGARVARIYYNTTHFLFDTENPVVFTSNMSVDGTIQIIPRTSANCGTATEGGIYYNSTARNMYFCNSTEWIGMS